MYKYFRASALALAVTAVLAGCGLPRPGPTQRELLASDVNAGGDVHVLAVDDDVARKTRVSMAYGFSREFLDAGNISVERIHSGDVLSITIWENIENGLFSSLGVKVTTLPEKTVDERGNIFVPYAGTLKVSGMTPEEVRRKLTEALSGQTPDPQIEVRRIAGAAASVYIIGGTGGQGIYPIRAETRRLTQMLASAAGLVVDPNLTKVTVQRGRTEGSVWMHDLVENPEIDIALKPGDRIVIQNDDRYFISMGTTRQRKVNLEGEDPNAVQALAMIGGLDGNTSNPRGIFVLRNEPPEVANRVLGRTDITEPQRFAYVLDITKPSALFIAQDFYIRDGDLLYVTEAPYVAWRTILSALIGSANSLSQLDTAIGKLGEIGQ